ncbi:hypothetical protein [Thermotoga petrophila]|uniref:hypothetical protein n=1 Tax=Thermotoga petrophila TaxID=93929 RepID=UPI0000EB814B
MKKIIPALLLITFLSGCMTLLNIKLPDGVYVVGDFSNGVPSSEYKMALQGDFYTLELPSSVLSFENDIAWYQVVVVENGKPVKTTSEIPLWKQLVGATVTIYATPNLMENDTAKGVGDSEKETPPWYCAGDFNNWTLEEMTYQDGKFVLNTGRTVSSGETIQYKIARNTDWTPYEEQFDGTSYEAGYGKNATFTADKDGTFVIEFDPKTSTLQAYVE